MIELITEGLFISPIVVVIVGLLALFRSEVHSSGLVRVGFAVFVVGIMQLFVAGQFTNNPFGSGLLSVLMSAVAAALMTVGAVHGVLKRALREKNANSMNRDIAALIAEATRSRSVWPDQPALPQVDVAAAHGRRAAPALVSLLGSPFDEASDASGCNVHVQQQAALALCKIFGVVPTAGQTVYDLRSTPEENGQVRAFWRSKIRSTMTM